MGCMSLYFVLRGDMVYHTACYEVSISVLCCVSVVFCHIRKWVTLSCASLVLG